MNLQVRLEQCTFAQLQYPHCSPTTGTVPHPHLPRIILRCSTAMTQHWRYVCWMTPWTHSMTFRHVAAPLRHWGSRPSARSSPPQMTPRSWPCRRYVPVAGILLFSSHSERMCSDNCVVTADMFELPLPLYLSVRFCFTDDCSACLGSNCLQWLFEVEQRG